MVGDNSDLFPRALQLYARPGQRILDMTYGRGVFWRQVDRSQYLLITNDLQPGLAECCQDFRRTRFTRGTFSVVVLDPPYATRSGSTVEASVDRGYNNAQRALQMGVYGTKAMMSYYRDGIREAWRLLTPGGVLMVKCMDEIMGGKQVRNSFLIWTMSRKLGFVDEDCFVLVQKGTPTMRHDHQQHARKNHSFLWIYRKPKQRKTRRTE